MPMRRRLFSEYVIVDVTLPGSPITKTYKCQAPRANAITSNHLRGQVIHTEVFVRFFPSTHAVLCSLIITVATIGIAPNVHAAQGPAARLNAISDNSDSNSSPNVSGSWHLSWAGRDGSQRQATLELKQDGSKLSGTLEAERGSVPVNGTLQANQVSFSIKMPRRQASFTGTIDGDKMSGKTEKGAAWSATRQ
jgi:hypothetical protein